MLIEPSDIKTQRISKVINKETFKNIVTSSIFTRQKCRKVASHVSLAVLNRNSLQICFEILITKQCKKRSEKFWKIERNSVKRFQTKLTPKEQILSKASLKRFGFAYHNYEGFEALEVIELLRPLQQWIISKSNLQWVVLGHSGLIGSFFGMPEIFQKIWNSKNYFNQRWNIRAILDQSELFKLMA